MNKVKLTLKPHPACKTYGEMIDIYTDSGIIPWVSVHIDALHTSGGNELHERLGRNMETVTVWLSLDEAPLHGDG